MYTINNNYKQLYTYNKYRHILKKYVVFFISIKWLRYSFNVADVLRIYYAETL